MCYSTQVHVSHIIACKNCCVCQLWTSLGKSSVLWILFGVSCCWCIGNVLSKKCRIMVYKNMKYHLEIKCLNDIVNNTHVLHHSKRSIKSFLLIHVYPHIKGIALCKKQPPWWRTFPHTVTNALSFRPVGATKMTRY